LPTVLQDTDPYLEPAPEQEQEQDDEGPIEEGKANAAVIMLARNTELEGALSSMRQFEDRFNHRFQYPWIFLNEEPFTDKFKELVELFLFKDCKVF
jgi:alpha 1,2-mannosyltransferase